MVDYVRSTPSEEGDELLEVGRMCEEDIREREYLWIAHEKARTFAEDTREKARLKEERKYSRRTPSPLPAPRRLRSQ